MKDSKDTIRSHGVTERNPIEKDLKATGHDTKGPNQIPQGVAKSKVPGPMGKCRFK